MSTFESCPQFTRLTQFVVHRFWSDVFDQISDTHLFDVYVGMEAQCCVICLLCGGDGRGKRVGLQGLTQKIHDARIRESPGELTLRSVERMGQKTFVDTKLAEPASGRLGFECSVPHFV